MRSGEGGKHERGGEWKENEGEGREGELGEEEARRPGGNERRTSFCRAGTDIEIEDPFLPGDVILSVRKDEWDGQRTRRGRDRRQRRRKRESSSPLLSQTRSSLGPFPRRLESTGKERNQKVSLRLVERGPKANIERDGGRSLIARARAHLSLRCPFRPYRFPEGFHSV